MRIRGKKIGPGHPVYIIAEISANHHRHYDEAKKLVREAKAAGADAVKLQTYTPDSITIDAPQKYFRVRGGTLWDRRTLYSLYQEAYMPWDWQPKLKKYAEEIGIDLFSSAFDPTAVDFLEKMRVPAHKVASFELTDIPLIRKIARTRKPMILSTGMATLQEIAESVAAARSCGAKQIALLKCTSAYPAPAEEMNLRVIPALIKKFKVPVGLSDHTMGSVAALGAVALGASIIEKHFTLSRSLKGPDGAFSAEPHELKSLVADVRRLEKSLGKARVSIGSREKKSRIFRRSLFVVKDVSRGEMFTQDNLRSIRPGYGLPPKYFHSVLNKKSTQDLPRGTPLARRHVAGTGLRRVS